MYTAVIAAGFGISLLAYAGLSAVFSDERTVRRQLLGLTRYESDEATKANPVLAPFTMRVLRPVTRRIATLMAGMTPAGYAERIGRRLTIAGRPRRMTAERFVVMKILVLIASGCAFSAAALVSKGSTVTWLLAVAGAALSFWVPDVWLRATADQRRTAIRRALPDMLDMLTISVEAGLGFDQAVARLVQSTEGPLAVELGRALQRIQAGDERSVALAQLSDTCDVAELSTFVAAVMQADVLGVSISKVLRTHAREMRLVRRQRAEELAQKAPVKLVFPLVLCMLPATVIVIMGPAIIRIARAFGAM